MKRFAFSAFYRIMNSFSSIAIPMGAGNFSLMVCSITRWPAKGWRPVDTDSGDDGGTTEGTFHSQWKGDILYGSNEAVGGKYILGYN